MCLLPQLFKEDGTWHRSTNKKGSLVQCCGGVTECPRTIAGDVPITVHLTHTLVSSFLCGSTLPNVGLGGAQHFDNRFLAGSEAGVTLFLELVSIVWLERVFTAAVLTRVALKTIHSLPVYNNDLSCKHCQQNARRGKHLGKTTSRCTTYW